MSVLDCEPLKVIAEVVNLKEEDLVTPEGREGEKGTNSLVNADSFYANFTNTTFEKKPLFLAMREKSPNSFTNTSQLLG